VEKKNPLKNSENKRGETLGVQTVVSAIPSVTRNGALRIRNTYENIIKIDTLKTLIDGLPTYGESIK